MSRRVVFTIEGPEGRLDEIAFSAESGAILADSTSTTKYSPVVAISSVFSVRVEDPEAEERAKAERARLTSYYPNPKGEHDE